MKSFILALLVICCWLILNSYSSRFAPSDMYYAQFFNSISKNNDEYSIILGNSRSLSALDPVSLSDALDTPVFHLGYSGSNALTQLTILRYALRQNPSLKTIILEFSPFHLDSRRVHTRSITSTLIGRNPTLIFHKSLLASQFFGALFPSSQTLPRVKNLFTDYENSSYSARTKCNTDLPIPFQTNYDNMQRVFPDSLLHFDKISAKYFAEILSISNENDLDLQIILTPSSHKFKSYFHNYNEYKEFLRNFTDSMRMVTIHDLDDSSHELYMKDADHIACPQTFTKNIVTPFLAKATKQHAPN